VYDPSPDIQWADVVVIAVSDVELAERLYKLADGMGKLVNDATDASRTHVVVPYEREVAGLRIAVTSEGAAGTPARLSLDVIEECIKRSWIPAFYEVYSVLKKEAKAWIPEAKQRLRFYQQLAEDGVFMSLVKSGDLEGALARGRELLAAIYKELNRQT
jgi:precorrin-2 dehydrogenase/sirohydrochlorin ferrochelatase